MGLMNVSAGVLAVAMGAVDGGATIIVVGGILAYMETACGVALTAADNGTIGGICRYVWRKIGGGKKLKPKSEEENQIDGVQKALKKIGDFIEKNEFEALHGIGIPTLRYLVARLLKLGREQTQVTHRLSFGRVVTLARYGIFNEVKLIIGGEDMIVSKEFFITEKLMLLRRWIDAMNAKQDAAMKCLETRFEQKIEMLVNKRLSGKVEEIIARLIHKNPVDPARIRTPTSRRIPSMVHRDSK